MLNQAIDSNFDFHFQSNQFLTVSLLLPIPVYIVTNKNVIEVLLVTELVSDSVSQRESGIFVDAA